MKTLTSIIFKDEKRREIGQNTGITSKFFSVLSFVIVFCTLAGFMVWCSINITKKLKEINQPYLFIGIMLAGNFLIVLVESIFQVINSLYFSKDLKILLRMPINSIDIVHGKLLKLITSEYQMELIMLAVPMIVYGIMSNLELQYYLYIPIILIFLPIIPICITSIVVSVVIKLTSACKSKNKIMYVTIIISLILIDLILEIMRKNGISLNWFSGQALMQENSIAINIAQNFQIIKPITNSLLDYNSTKGILNMGAYIFESILTYIITLMIISPIYLKSVVGTISSGEKSKVQNQTKLTLEDFKAQTIEKAYMKKEYLTIKRSPIFFIQCIVMPVIMSTTVLAVIVGIIIVMKNNGLDLIKQMSIETWFSGAFLAIVQVFYMLNFSSIIAISKDHKWAILCKYIPIKLCKQINLKLRIGKFTNFISSLAVFLLYYYCTKRIMHTIILLAISYGINAFGEKIKIFIDLKNPRFDWDNEYTMMKQNTNVMYELFYTMILIIIIVGLGFIVKDLNLYLVILSMVVLFINIRINKYIETNDDEMFVYNIK